MAPRKSNLQGIKTKEKLLKTAIICLSEEGIHQLSFQSISEKSKVPQPLVVYHFKNKESIFPQVWNYIYELALKKTESTLSKSESAADRLRNYLKVSIAIFSETPEITRIYFQLHYLSLFDPMIKQMNTQIKRKAVNRVASIIIDGQKKKEFKSIDDPYMIAKVIHSSLVGIFINSITEYEDFELKQVLQSFEDQTLSSLI